MARKRTQKDSWIPPYVNRGKSAWEYRPKGGPCVRLCALDSPKSLVLKRHAQEFERLTTKEGSFKALVEKYMASAQFKKLSIETQKDYTKYWTSTAKDGETKSAKLEDVFGRVDAKKITKKHIRKYMDLKGKSSETQANRHLAFLSGVFKWGTQWSDIEVNPCLGITRFEEQARERYIEDWEYDLVYKHANDTVRAAMEISYLCAARQGDVLKLTKGQLEIKGIFIRQGKTGKKQIKAWTVRLRKATTMVKPFTRKDGSTIESIYVIHTRSGTAYTSGGFRTMWRKALVKAREESGEPLDFTFHDIKAKAISDFEGNQAEKQEFSGHKTARQVETYDRKIKVVPTLKKD